MATTVSSQAFLLRNFRARIGRYTSKNGTDCTAQISYSPTPITTLKAFWPPASSPPVSQAVSQCGSNPPLSHERKRSLFWQFHRSCASQEYTALLGNVLKGLCDAGILLSHEVRPVDTTEFDVSDLLDTRRSDSASRSDSGGSASPSPQSPPAVPCLHVQDPVTQTTLPILATPEIMDRQEALGQGMSSFIAASRMR